MKGCLPGLLSGRERRQKGLSPRAHPENNLTSSGLVQLVSETRKQTRRLNDRVRFPPVRLELQAGRGRVSGKAFECLFPRAGEGTCLIPEPGESLVSRGDLWPFRPHGQQVPWEDAGEPRCPRKATSL